MSFRDIRRKYGQNYLKDPAVLFEMGEAISANQLDNFVEIGPGLGALTNQINKKGVNIIGVDIDAAVAGEGVGYSAESTLRLADIFSFSDNSGLFLGGSLEGSYLQPRNDLNLSFYNKELTVNDILKSKKLHGLILQN